MMLSAEDLPNPDKMKDNIYHGSVLPTMNKKLISNSLNVLYAKIGQCHSKALTTEVSSLPDDGRGQDVPPALLRRGPQRPQPLLVCRPAAGPATPTR